jgi:hypothetical protein
MAKKLFLIIASILCILALTACAAVPAAAPANTASPAVSQQSAAPAPTTPTPTVTASPTPASVSPSASVEASASPSESASDDLGFTLENIIKEDSLNRNYQNTPVTGETIKVTIVRNTLTFDVTLDKNIKPEDFTADMQAKYKQDLQNQIDMLSQEYDGLIDCTFIYNLSNKSGTKLMSLTQDFKAQ